MKHIITFTLCLLSINLFAADNKLNKKIKRIPQNSSEVPVAGFSGFDHLPDEVAINIPLQFTGQKDFDRDSLKDFINLSVVSKRFNAMAQDKFLKNQLSLIERAYLYPNIFWGCTSEKGNELLMDISNQKSLENQAHICKRISEELQCSEPSLHPLIFNPINHSDVPFFQCVQKILNLEFTPLNQQELFLGTFPQNQQILIQHANNVWVQRFAESHLYTFSYPHNPETQLKYNKKAWDAFIILQTTLGSNPPQLT